MEGLFFLLYSVATAFAYVISLPFLAIFSLKAKYKDSIPARFFLRHNSPLKENGIWFHVCSFGEAKAIASLVEKFPKEKLRMSAITHTGFEVIRTYASQSRYLPFEPLLFGWIKPQRALVVMEAEFWYLLFALAKKRGAKTILINARMSDRSFPKYLKMAWLYRHIFKQIDEVYAQSRLDKERLEQLGAKNVRVTGNIKLASLPSVQHKLEKPSHMVVCAASTHEGEEGLVLEAYRALKKEEPEAMLIVVPRHPERFESVEKMLQAFSHEMDIAYERYSQNLGMKSDVVLVDVLGALVDIYAISDLVILGGAFEPIGGHNAAEAAQFGCKIISGEHYFNQKDIFEACEGIAVVEASNLTKRVLQHHMLKPARIKYQADITPIIESLQDVLSD
ncbi:MAG: lipid IV(A) 3-deoxy-D-manno-octulosonic acid transferase [Campylobacterales bacterium]|nr:lipid IV(A) 3-deoxy-D-manno-octulosonic acid transferase [Campylobacterales bacterium]